MIASWRRKYFGRGTSSLFHSDGSMYVFDLSLFSRSMEDRLCVVNQSSIQLNVTLWIYQKTFFHLSSFFASDKQVSPKSGTLKSPPKGFEPPAISKTYYNLVRIQFTFGQIIVFTYNFVRYCCLCEERFLLIWFLLSTAVFPLFCLCTCFQLVPIIYFYF